MSIKNVCDTVVHASLESVVNVFSHTCKIISVVVSDVGVELPSVIADGVEMLVTPVFVSEQSTAVCLDGCTQTITGVVILVW